MCYGARSTKECLTRLIGSKELEACLSCSFNGLHSAVCVANYGNVSVDIIGHNSASGSRTGVAQVGRGESQRDVGCAEVVPWIGPAVRLSAEVAKSC